ncbi:MAG: lycopene cyclase domain-containing protein [Acidimicrobiales bacterium]
MDVDRFQYLILMGLCLLITLPLEFLFGARVWRRPRRLAAAMGIPLVIFLVWDVVAIARDHWDYNPDYVTGWELPFNLPIEELSFFLVIPICSLLTLEAVRRVLGRD